MASKGYIGCIITSIVLTSALCIFLIPLTTPFANQVLQGITDVSENGIVLQTKKLVINDHAEITEEDSTLALMNNTYLNITVQQNSRINARFSGVFRLTMKSGDVKYADYKIILMLQGVTGQNIHIYYYDHTGSTTNSLYLTFPFYIEFLSDKLDAGTYFIAVYWQSLYDHPSDLVFSRLYASDHDNVAKYHDYARTMIVQELGE